MKKTNAGVMFHDSIASSWSGGYKSKGFSKRLQAFCDRFDEIVEEGQCWLDAGCGSGVLTRELEARGAHGEAVDAAPAMIEAATKEADGTASRFNYSVIETIEHLGMERGLYDGVLCSSVIEYVPSPQQAISELYRVLKPGGHVILSLPHRFSLLRMIQKAIRAMAKWRNVDKYSYLAVSKNEFTETSARAALGQAGFDVLDVKSFDPMLPKQINVFARGSLILIVARKPE